MLCFASLAVCVCGGTVPTAQRDALLEFCTWRNAALRWCFCDTLMPPDTSTNGAAWTTNTNWGDGGDECAWFGVACGAGTVTRVYDAAGTWELPQERRSQCRCARLLPNNNLDGSIPWSFFDVLTDLQEVDFSVNAELDGPLPPTVGNATDLVQMYVLAGGVFAPEALHAPGSPDSDRRCFVQQRADDRHQWSTARGAWQAGQAGRAVRCGWLPVFLRCRVA